MWYLHHHSPAGIGSSSSDQNTPTLLPTAHPVQRPPGIINKWLLISLLYFYKVLCNPGWLLPISLRMVLNFGSSRLTSRQDWNYTRVCHHARYMPHWRPTPGLHTSYKSILPIELQLLASNFIKLPLSGGRWLGYPVSIHSPILVSYIRVHTDSLYPQSVSVPQFVVSIC